MHSQHLKNLALQPWNVVLLVLNFIGATVYVLAASHGWVIPQEQEPGVHSLTGEPFVWALYVFPIFATFFVLNFSWGVFIIARRQWRTAIFWLLTIPIWLVAAAIDFAHH